MVVGRAAGWPQEALPYRKRCDPRRALLNSGLDAYGGIKVSRFFPQCSRLIPSQDRETPNGVGNIQRRTGFMTPIKPKCLVVTTLRQIRASLLMIDITQMPDGVRQHKGFVDVAQQRHSFLIT
jgi:hypothetical protein